MQSIGINFVHLTQHHPLTPRAPTPQPPLILPRQPLHTLILLILIHLNTLAHPCILLMLDLQYPTNPLNLLCEVAGALPPGRRVGRVVAAVLRSERF